MTNYRHNKFGPLWLIEIKHCSLLIKFEKHDNIVIIRLVLTMSEKYSINHKALKQKQICKPIKI